MRPLWLGLIALLVIIFLVAGGVTIFLLIDRDAEADADEGSNKCLKDGACTDTPFAHDNVNSISKCYEFCQSKNECKFYVYHPSAKACTLTKTCKTVMEQAGDAKYATRDCNPSTS